jgi:hypothetical protein
MQETTVQDLKKNPPICAELTNELEIKMKQYLRIRTSGARHFVTVPENTTLRTNTT